MVLVTYGRDPVVRCTLAKPRHERLWSPLRRQRVERLELGLPILVRHDLGRLKRAREWTGRDQADRWERTAQPLRDALHLPPYLLRERPKRVILSRRGERVLLLGHAMPNDQQLHTVLPNRCEVRERRRRPIMDRGRHAITSGYRVTK